MKLNSKIIFPLVFILITLLPLLLYSGSIDSFAPLHSVSINQILSQGNIPQDLSVETPGFFALGTIISLITGISPNSLIFLPIQLVPMLLITYVLFKDFSNSKLIATLVLLVYVTLDITGVKFFFWVHGLGTIILFTSIFLLIKDFKDNKPEYVILLIISVISLVYISYDITFSFISLLLGFIIIIFLKGNKSTSRNLRNVLLIIIVIQLALSEFVYKTLIPQFQNESSSVAIDKFIFSYVNSASKFHYNDIAIAFPKIISYIGIMKYVILAIFIGLMAYLIIKNYKLHEKIDKELFLYGTVFLSFLIMNLSYIAAKSVLGQVAIGALLLTGLVSIALVYRFYDSDKIKKFAIGSLCGIILLNITTFGILSENSLINKDPNNYAYLENSAVWTNNYTNGIIVSDHLTKNIYLSYTPAIKFKNESINTKSLSLDPDKDIYPLIQKNPLKTRIKDKYYILNYKLFYLDLNGWNTIKPWKNYNTKIETNPSFNEIYNDGNVKIYN